jgi:hypothetical protein
LITFKHKQTGKIEERIVTYIPDLEYLKKHNNDISHNQINKLDGDFSGYLIYRMWDDSPEFTLKITGGKISMVYKQTKEKKKESNSIKVYVCVPMQTQHYTQMCWYTDPERTQGESCGPWVLTGTTYFNDCHYEADPYPTDPCAYGGCYVPQPSGGTQPSQPNPTPTPTPAPKNPCVEKTQVSAKAANATLAAQLNQLLSNLYSPNPAINGIEYGSEKNLQSLSGDVYKTTTTQPGSSDGFAASFSWNSTEGYTMGNSHNHIGGSAPSPDDVFVMIDQLNDQELLNSGISNITTYKNGVSQTIVTKSGNYVVTVANWGDLQQLFTTYKANKEAFQEQYRNIESSYKSSHPLATEGEPTTYALLSQFGDAINLYKSTPGTTSYSPLQITSTASTPTVSTKPCP